ncbi:TPA: hypothetical protein ACIJ04_005429, partial [Klebsiella pneumoniae]
STQQKFDLFNKAVAGLNAIIHENATAEDAYSLYMAK